MIPVHRSNPVSCVRPGRPAHKRVDVEPGDESVSKSPRLSESPVDAAPLGSSPGSPVSPVPSQQGPSRIGPFLLLPVDNRDLMYVALNVDTGVELVCKKFDLGLYQEKIRAYSVLPVHRNIARIRDIVLGERHAYVFLDKGHGDMHTFVKSCKRLSEGRAAKLFHQVASAVAHCHQHGIVLGDLKLRKFVFSDEERSRVQLEGLDDSHILGGDDSLSETHGCPAYVSPEILSGPGSYSGKPADVWSLGVTLYTMLVGRYPFHDADPAALFSKIRRGQCCLPDGLSPRAKCLLRSLLRKDPWERLTAAEVLIHPWLVDAVQETGVTEQEVALAEQTVPSFDEEEDSDLFC
ncbi:hypothetical protein DPEC_G00288900 [Dallia pectoralis]|uniref:Uncharacterized protein n=1 Tax=Dallia pectoralis TaxID=75939 RepID=A0ACC2FKU9_DALPE|nr:hypothetical protein DPEC_G00288900 [Dallia pectoralis]